MCDFESDEYFTTIAHFQRSKSSVISVNQSTQTNSENTPKTGDTRLKSAYTLPRPKT